MAHYQKLLLVISMSLPDLLSHPVRLVFKFPMCIYERKRQSESSPKRRRFH
jgi:hypothetical protein